MFIERLESELKDAQAAPSADDIRALALKIREQNSGEFLAGFQACFDECLIQHEKEIWDRGRKRPFDRILVKRFAHLFPPEGGLDEDDGIISRRILPGFFQAIRQLAGPQLFEQCQLACKGIVKRKREEQGTRLHWHGLYQNDEANELVDDILVVVATHFDDFSKRCEWLHDLLDSHLAPYEDYAFEGESEAAQHWSLSPQGALLLMRELYAPFRGKLAAADSRGLLEKRFGAKACQTLDTLLENLYRDE